MQGGTVQAIMSATVPPGLCESSQAHSGAFVFIIPGLPSVPLLIPFPAERPLRALSLMPGRAMPRRWALRLRAGDCVSPRPRGKPPDDEPQGGRTGEAQSSGEPPCLNHPGTVPARPWHAVRISLRCRAPGHRAAPRAAERAPAGSVRLWSFQLIRTRSALRARPSPRSQCAPSRRSPPRRQVRACLHTAR